MTIAVSQRRPELTAPIVVVVGGGVGIGQEPVYHQVMVTAVGVVAG